MANSIHGRGSQHDGNLRNNVNVCVELSKADLFGGISQYVAMLNFLEHMKDEDKSCRRLESARQIT